MLDKGLGADLESKQLAIKVKKFAVSGLGTPIKDQDKYIC